MRNKIMYILMILLICLFSAGISIADDAKLTNKSVAFKQARIARYLQIVKSQGKDIPGTKILSSKAKKPARIQVKGNGGIKGTVYGLDDSDIFFAFVEVFPADFDSMRMGAFAQINPDGSYFIDGLSAGSYYVSAWVDGYVFKFYDDVLNIYDATPVEVDEVSATEGIDFDMEKITEGSGSISGTVIRENDNEPVVEAIVFSFSSDDPWLFGWAETDDDGSYKITELTGGNYYVAVWAEGYLTELYDNATTFEEAKLVEVVEPNETTDINFALGQGGTISGVVVNDEGEPLGDVYVEAITALRDSTDPAGWDENPFSSDYGYTITDDNGKYSLTGLQTENYFVSAFVWNDWNDFMEWYDNAETFEDATPVFVQQGQDVTNINFQLSFTVASGFIAGQVTDQQGNAIPDVFVQVQSVSDFTKPVDFWAYAITDEDGYYHVENLSNGSYIVSACVQISWEFVCRYWQDAETPHEATIVKVDEMNNPDSIDFVLPLTIGTASITGTVVADDGRVLAGAIVEISPADLTYPTPDVIYSSWAYGITDSSGNYQVNHLPAGEYFVYTSYWENGSFGEQWYDHADSLGDATSIILSDGETRDDVDFFLTLKSIYGSLTGVVVDSLTGLPISRAYVEVSPLYEICDVGARFFYDWPYYAITDENGKYQIEEIWEGEYIVSVYTNGAFEYFENTALAEHATPVKIVSENTTEVNFDLVLRNQGSGIISGIVALDVDMPLEIAVVFAYPAGTNAVWPQPDDFYTAVTDLAGSYKIQGLPAGEYYVMSFAPGIIGEYYDDVYDPSQATPVNVDGITPTTGIDFILSPIWFVDNFADNAGVSGSAMIVGLVTDNKDQSISGATIYAFNESGQPVSFTRTKTNGNYELTGLPPGKYIFQAGGPGYESQFNGGADSYSQAIAKQVAMGTFEINFSLTPKTSTSVKDQDNYQAPKSIKLYGNYPNPFNPETQIFFALPKTMNVKLRVFNISGKEVAQLHNGTLSAGSHNVIWNGLDQHGRPVASGLYIYRLEGKQAILTGKMMLMR